MSDMHTKDNTDNLGILDNTGGINYIVNLSKSGKMGNVGNIVNMGKRAIAFAQSLQSLHSRPFAAFFHAFKLEMPSSPSPQSSPQPPKTHPSLSLAHLDAHRGLLRWHIHYNLLMLR